MASKKHSIPPAAENPNCSKCREQMTMEFQSSNGISVTQFLHSSLRKHVRRGNKACESRRTGEEDCSESVYGYESDVVPMNSKQYGCLIKVCARVHPPVNIPAWKGEKLIGPQTQVKEVLGSC